MGGGHTFRTYLGEEEEVGKERRGIRNGWPEPCSGWQCICSNKEIGRGLLSRELRVLLWREKLGRLTQHSGGKH